MGGKASFTELLNDVFKSVKAGKGFSQALMPHQNLFGEFYINMVRSGEAGGQLADVLSRLAEHLERVRGLARECCFGADLSCHPGGGCFPLGVPHARFCRAAV